MRFFNLLLFLIISTTLLLDSNAQKFSTPSSYDNLKFWVVADSLVSSSPPLVDQLIDLSPDTNHAIQSITGEKPTQLINELNGHSVIQFDGVDDYLTFNEINNVRTAFWVLKEDSNATLKFRGLFGHSSTKDYYRSTSSIFSTSASVLIRNGETRLNSVLIDATTTNMPTDYSIISVKTTGNTAISSFSKDRSFSDRVWNGEVAEIIVYSDTLTVIERTSIERYLRCKYFPAICQSPVSLGRDVFLENNFCDTTIDAGAMYSSFLWNTGETTQTIEVNKTGDYYVTAIDSFGYQSSDTIYIEFPSFKYPSDSIMCLGDSLPWNTQLNNSDFSFLWSNASTDSLINITQAGDYWVKVTDNFSCFKSSDTISITVDSFPALTSLGPDKTVCLGAAIGLTSNTFPSSYLWNTAENTPQITIDTAGQYWLQSANSNACRNNDTINIAISGTAPTVGFTAQALCLNEPVQFTDTSSTSDGSNIIAWDWSFGDGSSTTSSSPQHQYDNDSNYVVTFTIQTDSLCENATTQNIQIHQKPTAGFFTAANPFFLGQSINFTDSSFSNDGDITAWNWNFGADGTSDTSSLEDPSYDFPLASNYTVQQIVSSQYNCKDTATNSITVIDVTMPGSYDNLKFWVVADSLVSSSPPLVDQLIDLSPDTNHAIQSIIGEKPTQLINELNGHSVIQFDGVDDYLAFNEINNVRTVFWVLKEDSNATLKFRGLFGHSSTKNYYRSTSSIFSTSASVLIRNGETRLNSVLIDATTTNMPTDYSIISLKTTGNTAISSFSKERSFSDRVWHGEVAEIIVYSDTLTVIERTSIERYLRCKYFPAICQSPVSLGRDIFLENNFCDTTIDAGAMYSSFLWNTGETTQTIEVNKTGDYYVTTIDSFGYQSSDTIYIEFPSFKYPSDSIMCLGDSLPWNTQLNSSDFTFLWSNGATDSLLSISQVGEYWVKLTDASGCFRYSDTLSIALDSFPAQASLGPDKTICKGSTVGLTSNTSPTSYLWNTDETSSQIIIDTAGIYFIEVLNNNNCIARDTIIIDTSGIAPTINFTVQDLCSNSSSQFTNTSTTADGSNIISEKWDFGDGDTTTTPNPSHQYPSNLTYTVSLEVLSDSGCVNTLDSILQIHNPSTSGLFVNNNPICSGNATNFSDNSFSTDGTIDSWSWNFGDTGTTDTSMLQFPNYEYPVTNIYHVQLITTTQYGCSDTTTVPITVKQSPIASFTTTAPCLGSTTQFNTTSQGNIFAINWDFGDFNTSTLNDPTNTYNSSGAYNIRLIATEVNGCKDTLTTVVTIVENPIANFETRDLCAEASAQLYDSSTTNSGTITNWNWNVENHPNQSNEQHPIFSFTTLDTGVYHIDLTVLTDVGCTDSIRDSIHVYPLPSPSFAFTPTTGSPLQVIDFTNQTSGTNTYSWSFGDGSTSTEITPSHSYQDSSTYTIDLIATTAYGCVDSTSKSIQILYKITDIAVNDVSYAFTSNSEFLSLTTHLSNLGSFTINNFDLEIEIEGFGTTLEKWTGSLDVGSSLAHAISSYFEVNNKIPELICVRALHPNNEVDDHPENNEFCITVNKFQLISISPNPTSSTLNLSYIIPETGEATVILLDAYGNKVKGLYSGNIKKGLIRQTFNLTNFNAGVYIIEISYQGNAIREKIILK